MLRDWGSRDDDFIALTREVRTRLVAMLDDAHEDYDCVPMQGSGTFSVEAMLNSFIPACGKALIPSNGAYARRIARVMDCLGRTSTVLEKGDGQPLCGVDIAEALDRDPAITHVVAVHCETSSGMLNPLSAMASATRQVHEAEGGVAGRGARYARNRDILVAGMRNAGFVTLLDDRWQSPVIVTFLCPADAAFDFDRFYELMKARGFVIYPGKQTAVESFRIGSIGDLDEDVMRQVVAAARASLSDMGVASAAPSLVQSSAEVSQR